MIQTDSTLSIDQNKEQPPPEAPAVDEDDDDAEEDGVANGAPATGAHMHFLFTRFSWVLNLAVLGDAKKKKKKKKPKKKAKGEVQSEPPRVGLSKLFPSGIYPEGEIQEYKDECVYRSLYTSA